MNKQDELVNALIWEIQQNPAGLRVDEALSGKRYQFHVKGNEIEVYISPSYAAWIGDVPLKYENAQKIIEAVNKAIG